MSIQIDSISRECNTVKTFNLVSVLGVIIILTSSAFVQAQNFGSPYGGAPRNQGAPRTFLGLPVPQQWTETRPGSMNQYGGQGSTFCSGNDGPSSSCANGSCATGSCTTGRCTTGNCPTGNCANGQCTTRRPVISQPSSASCVNGQCRLNQSPNTRTYSKPEYEAQGNWSPRTSRSNVEDPFRGAAYENQNDEWMTRPGSRNPMNDLLPSRYNSEDLDLRRPYFNNQSGELNRNRASESSFGADNIRAPRPAGRAIFGAPVDRGHGVAQI